MQITLLVLEAVNIFIALLFLGLFVYRLNYLRHFSQTDTYLSTFNFDIWYRVLSQN